MSAQLAPEASHRRHWRAYVITGVPVHVPSVSVSVSPSVVIPEIAGGAVSAGGIATATTTALGVLAAEVEPTELVAVTTTTIVEPTSAEVSASVVLVAPAMSAQFAPAESQRCHW